MSLADRLKRARESLGYTQKEMASAVSVILQTWQVYEAGKSVPGGNVLEALARIGLNVNWLLTGLGTMRLVTSDYWAVKFKEIRGDLSVQEFVKEIGFTDPENAIATIEAIENAKLDPDYNVFSVLSNNLGISIDWMFGWQGIPKMISNRTTGAINLDLLQDIVKEVEVHDSINPGSLTSEKKAQLIAMLYAMRV